MQGEANCVTEARDTKRHRSSEQRRHGQLTQAGVVVALEDVTLQTGAYVAAIAEHVQSRERLMVCVVRNGAVMAAVAVVYVTVKHL